MKKKLKMVTAVFFMVCAIFHLPVVPTALADDDVLVSGDFEYYISPETAHEDYRGTVVITKYLGNDADVIVPSEIDGKTVTLIDDDAFRNNEKLKSVKLPDTLIGIGVEAFAFCKSLESVNIPEGIKDLSPAFRGCEMLKSIVIPEGIERIEQGMFRDCISLENVTLPNSLKIIDGSTFEKCTSLKTITLPNGVVEIGANAFGGCTALSEISLPESVMYIGASAFGNTAFYNDAENWENGVLYVDGCLIDSKREEIKGEYSVKEGTRIIAVRAFSRAKGLEMLKLPEGLKVICNAAFDECTSLKTAELPAGLETIGNSAFQNCAIDEITIPEGVKTIGELAFMDCKLRKLTLPKSLESIGSEAFANNSISKLVYNGTESDWKEKNFDTAIVINPYAIIKFSDGNNEESDPKALEDSGNNSDAAETASASTVEAVEESYAYIWITLASVIAIIAIVVLILFLFKNRKNCNSAN